MSKVNKFKAGERVLISPQVTRETNWIEATITEIEENPFIGMVINAKTDNGILFFEKPDMFRIMNEENTFKVGDIVNVSPDLTLLKE